jgi:hypothetical protein
MEIENLTAGYTKLLTTEESQLSLDELTGEQIIQLLTLELNQISYSSLFELIKQRDDLLKVIIARYAIKCKEDNLPFLLTIEKAQRKVSITVNNRRKKFVRRAWKSEPLFALEVIKVKYPDYTESMLLNDLKLNKPYKRREKFVKRPSHFGLRISQIKKLKGLLKVTDPTSREYNKYCNQIVGYMTGLKLKTPIILRVKYNGEIYEYEFPWYTWEFKIKSFIALSKTVNSVEELNEKWNATKHAGR